MIQIILILILGAAAGWFAMTCYEYHRQWRRDQMTIQNLNDLLDENLDSALVSFLQTNPMAWNFRIVGYGYDGSSTGGEWRIAGGGVSVADENLRRCFKQWKYAREMKEHLKLTGNIEV